MEDKSKYNWQYCSVGGVVRVKIASGEDLAHLGELDQKLWTVLSCPTKGLEFDGKTLELLDTDADGKIRVPEVVSAAEWLTTVIKDRNSILEGRKALPLALIDTGNEAGQKLYDSAKRVLEYLGLDKEEIALEDIEDTTKIFAGTKFNGDGVITAVSSDDEDIKKVIGQVIEAVGSVEDRSGEPGITVGKAEPLFARIDKDEMYEKIEARQKANAAAETANNEKVKEELAGVAKLAEISIDDFAKVELRVAEIKACEPIKRAKKLLKLTLDDGEGERTVASGIAPWYKPEDLTGHKVIIVSNLKPAKLCGVESQGMILAADNAEDDVKVIFVDDLNTGAKIR